MSGADGGGGDDGNSSVSSGSSPEGDRRGAPVTPAVAAALALVEVMADVLASTEQALLTSSGVNCSLSGTTAVIILLRGGFVHTVNVGDSRSILTAAPRPLLPLAPAALAAASAASTLSGNPVAMLTAAAAGGGGVSGSASGGGSAATLAAAASSVIASVLDAPPLGGGSGGARVRVLTVDHKPEHPKEKARILAAGGRVMATRVKSSPHLLGPPRVWLKSAPMPGLNMSRSLGDLVGKQAGVVSTPHKALDALAPGDRVLVLASDGLWDWVANAEVAAVALSTDNCWEAAALLARLSRARWLVRSGGADDTTVVVVRLGVGGGGVTTGGGGTNPSSPLGGGGGGVPGEGAMPVAAAASGTIAATPTVGAASPPRGSGGPDSLQLGL